MISSVVKLPAARLQILVRRKTEVFSVSIRNHIIIYGSFKAGIN